MGIIRSAARWLRPRSDGVRVRRATWRAITRGDRARAAGRWLQAAIDYRAALAIEPDLGHIWVQAGHCAKEAGDAAAAMQAYARAADLVPGDIELHLALADLCKRAGGRGAAQHFLAALRLEPDNLVAAREMMQHLLGRHLTEQAVLDETLTLLGIDRQAIMPAEMIDPAARGMAFFDVSDLLAFFSHSRFPSGVQRLQIEVMRALLAGPDAAAIRICHYSPARQGWTLVAAASFIALCEKSLAEAGRADWAAELRLAYVASALADDLAFPAEAVLVSFGASSPDANYLLNVRTAVARDRLTYVPIVYDLIPVIYPHWFAVAHAREFLAHARSLIHSASGYVAISQATRRDLIAYAAGQGVPVDADLVRVTPLDGDAVKPPTVVEPTASLARRGLIAGAYVLFVSTIEPRKNHLGAFRAWRSLAAEIGPDLPRLVCVGGKGWLNDDIHAELAADPVFGSLVSILSDVSDAELDTLYRHCAFTLYPSFYEGWGLPVTESLSYGKVPVIANTASLPEAGGAFAVYFDPHDPAAMARAIRPLLLDPAALAARERRIRQDYRPRSWQAVAGELARHAREIATLVPLPRAVPPVVHDRPMSFAALGADGRGAEAEVFRLGRGWSLPGADGCRVGERDAVIRLPGERTGCDVRVELAAGPAATGYRLRWCEGERQGDLAANEHSAVTIGLPASRTVLDIVVERCGPGDLTVRSLTVSVRSADEDQHDVDGGGH